jgi:L,D-transpeptidase YcbB
LIIDCPGRLKRWSGQFCLGKRDSGGGWTNLYALALFPLASFRVLVTIRSFFIWLLCTPVLLSCDAPAGRQAAASAGAASVLAATPPALPTLIRALLDTTVTARLDLQASADTRAFYDSTYTPAWVGADTLSTAAALALLAQAPAYGLRMTYYHWPLLPQLLRDSLTRPAAPLRRAQQQARFEVLLTDAVLRFMSDLRRGRLHPHTPSAAEEAAKQPWQPAAVLRAGLAQGQVGAAMTAGQPTNREYQQLQRALAAWLAHPADPADSLGLHQAQYEQAAVNLERWRWDAFAAESAYVLVNLPAYELAVIDHDSAMQQHRVIIGSPKTPTPTFSSRIGYFTLAPDWNVPRSIAIKEMLPRLRKDAGYLERNELALFDQHNQLLDATRINWSNVTDRSFNYQIRQAAGCDNALGNIVFRFANPYSIYIHDTPLRQFFRQNVRALSHGCIRLADPLKLASYLLSRENRTAELPSETECANQPRPRDIRLRHPMPLHICYATCVVEKQELRFLPDVYDLDEAIRKQLFPPATAE